MKPRKPLPRSKKPLRRSPLKKVGKRGKAKAQLMRELKARYPGDCQMNMDATSNGDFLEGLIDLHHKVLASQGGKTEPENLVRLCRRCHTLAHADFSILECIRASSATIANGEVIK